MADILGMASQAARAYRSALTTISENIANANTSGYSRREVSLQENPSPDSANVLSKSGGAGAGVAVGNVRRAHSAFLESSARRATSSYHALSSQKNLLDQLERMVLRSETDMGKFLQSFFTAGQNLINSPGSIPARTIFINRAESLVSQFGTQVGELQKSIESGMDDLKRNASELSEYARRLYDVNKKLRMPIKAGEQQPNYLLDERDRLLMKMSEYSNITVKETDAGSVYVYLSDRAAGVPLVAPDNYYKMEARYANQQVNYVLDPGGLNMVATDINGGKFSGVSNYFSQAQNVINKLNGLASAFARTVNDAHQQGIDMNGKMGRALFHTNKVKVENGFANVGAPYMTAKITDDSMVKTGESYRLTYQAIGSQWMLEHGDKNANGEFVPSKDRKVKLFKREFTIDGMRLQMGGKPSSGDAFILSFEQNAALALSMAFRDAKLVATAGTHVANKTSNNKGKGRIQLESNKIETEKLGNKVPTVDQIVKDNLAPGTAYRQNRTGLLARIPAGTKNFNIRSLNGYSGATFELPYHKLQSLGGRPSLALVMNGVQYKFPSFFVGGHPASALDYARKLNENPDFRNAGFEASVRGNSLEITNKRHSDISKVQILDETRGRRRVAAEPQLTMGQRNFSSTATSKLKTRDVPKLNTFSIKVNGDLHTFDFDPVGSKRDLVWKMNNLDDQGKTVSDTDFQKFRNLGLRARYDDVNDRIVIEPNIAHKSQDMTLRTNDNRQRTQFNGNVVRLLLQGGDYSFNLKTHARSLSLDQLRDKLNDHNEFRRMGMSAEIKNGRLLVTRLVNAKLEEPSFQERTAKVNTILETNLPNVKRYTAIIDGRTYNMDFAAIVGSTKSAKLENIRTQMNTKFQSLQVGVRAYLSADGDGITIRRSQGTSLVIESSKFFDAQGQTISTQRSTGIDTGLNGTSTMGKRGSDVHIFSRNGRHIAGPRPLTSEEQEKIFANEKTKAAYGMVASARYVSDYLNKPQGQTYRRIQMTQNQDLFKVDKQLTDERKVTLVAFADTNMRHRDVDTDRFYPGATYRMTIYANEMKSPENPDGKITVSLSDHETMGLSAKDITLMFERKFKSAIASEKLSEKIQVIRDGDNITFRNLTGRSMNVDVETTSRVRQSISLPEPAKEDYLIITTGEDTNRSFVASYDHGDPPTDFSGNQLRIIFTGAKSFDVFDKNTNTSVASYDYVKGKIYKVMGVAFSMTGDVRTGDSFTVESNTDGKGDSTNLAKLVQIKNKSDIMGPGSGSFQSIYNESRTRFASMIKTQGVSLNASKVMYEQALKKNDGVKGVSLDREANDLLRMQQAYSAAARVMQSSKELFDTLLRTI